MGKKSVRGNGTGEDPLSREIRLAIVDDGRTQYALAKLADVTESAVRRFVSRERSLSIGTAGKLAQVLGLQLVRKARPKPVRKDTPAVAPIEDPALDPIG